MTEDISESQLAEHADNKLVLNALLADLTSVRTQVVALIADALVLRTATNAIITGAATNIAAVAAVTPAAAATAVAPAALTTVV